MAVDQDPEEEDLEVEVEAAIDEEIEKEAQHRLIGSRLKEEPSA